MQQTPEITAESMQERQPVNGVQPKPAAEIQDKTIAIEGNPKEFTPGFWKLALPAIGARYIPRFLLANLLDPEGKLPEWGKQKFSGQNPAHALMRFCTENAYSVITGVGLFAITAYYGSQTLHDIKSVFAETVGFEKNKDPKDVTFRDIFSSENTIVSTTTKNFLNFNARRFGLDLLFVLPLKGAINAVSRALTHKDWIGEKTKFDQVDLGVGAINTYLVSDVLFRKENSFEKLQAIIDKKINHKSDNLDTAITVNDILSIVHNHKVFLDKSYTTPPQTSKESHADKVLATRITDLMNQTYNNSLPVEYADLSVGKLIFLLGNGLLDSEPANMAYLELANISHDMKEVRQVSTLIKGGMEPRDAFARYGVDVDRIAMPVQEELHQEFERYRDRVVLSGQVSGETELEQEFARYSSRAQQKSLAPVLPPATHQERRELSTATSTGKGF